LSDQNKISVIPDKVVMSKKLTQNIDKLYQRVKEIIYNAKNKAYQTINLEMVQAYWNVGREIAEEEQRGKSRADYGKHLIEEISNRLTKEYGKGFDQTNVWNMRKFYQTYPILDAVRRELSWTHYRLLMRVDKKNVREFYTTEAIEGNWSTRQLSRQINSLFFERTLMSRDKEGMLKKCITKGEKKQPEHVIKDPYVLEFLNIKMYLLKINTLNICYFILIVSISFLPHNHLTNINGSILHHFKDINSL
jgi:hypothetical protein